MRKTSLCCGVSWNFNTRRQLDRHCPSDTWIRRRAVRHHRMLSRTVRPKEKALMYRVILSCALWLGIAVAQNAQSTPATPSQNSNPTSQAGSAGQKTTPLALSRSQRLGAAKTAFVKKVEGSEIPVNVITNSLEGWGRYTLVSSPEKADLLIEITSPEEQPSSVTINGSHNNPRTGYPEASSSTSR